MRAIALALILASTPVHAQHDGDTINMRLWGIDAPELEQTCDGSKAWPAGALAQRALARLVVGRKMTCEYKSTDKYERLVVRCSVEGQDIAKAMVREGWAWAFTQYSRDYANDEQSARALGLGVWSHDCIPPWEWRRRYQKPASLR